MATRLDGTLLNSGGLDVKPRTEAQVAQHRAELHARAAKIARNPSPMGDVIARHYEKAAAEIKQTLEWRLQNLRDGIVQSRKNWRLLWGNYYTLRHENTVRRPAWRAEMETTARKYMRAEVRRYGELRIQLAELTAEGSRDLPVVRITQVDRVEG